MAYLLVMPHRIIDVICVGMQICIHHSDDTVLVIETYKRTVVITTRDPSNGFRQNHGTFDGGILSNK